MDKINEIYDMINSIYFQMFQLELNDELDDEQFDILVDFLKEKISEEEDAVKEYIDDGVSGANDNRPKFQELLCIEIIYFRCGLQCCTKE